jgi:hypothetical protein
MHLREASMPNANQVAKRAVTPPTWLTRPDGRKKQLEKARWNMERIAELFTDAPNEIFEVGDIARYVYGYNGKKNCANVRKHIPAQRTYMLSRLIPIVTRYGARGRIISVKLYDKTIQEDQRSMREELDRLRLRKELTEDRYQHLSGFLGL